MTINNSIHFFENLKCQAQNKSEQKIYNNFIEILSLLEKREMTEEEVSSLENYLLFLEEINPSKNKRKYFRKMLRNFKEYLKLEHSLITKGYYATLGTGIGMSFGIAFGAAFNNVSSGISFGMMFGMFIGLLIGRFMDSKAEKENRVLITRRK